MVAQLHAIGQAHRRRSSPITWDSLRASRMGFAQWGAQRAAMMTRLDFTSLSTLRK